MSNDERVMVFVRVQYAGSIGVVDLVTEEQAKNYCPYSRIAECHELREGDTILTARQYRDIAQFAGSMWPEEVREVAAKILGIIDGERP